MHVRAKVNVPALHERWAWAPTPSCAVATGHTEPASSGWLQHTAVAFAGYAQRLAHAGCARAPTAHAPPGQVTLAHVLHSPGLLPSRYSVLSSQGLLQLQPRVRVVHSPMRSSPLSHLTFLHLTHLSFWSATFSAMKSRWYLSGAMAIQF